MGGGDFPVQFNTPQPSQPASQPTSHVFAHHRPTSLSKQDIKHTARPSSANERRDFVGHLYLQRRRERLAAIRKRRATCGRRPRGRSEIGPARSCRVVVRLLRGVDRFGYARTCSHRCCLSSLLVSVVTLFCCETASCRSAVLVLCQLWQLVCSPCSVFEDVPRSSKLVVKSVPSRLQSVV